MINHERFIDKRKAYIKTIKDNNEPRKKNKFETFDNTMRNIEKGFNEIVKSESQDISQRVEVNPFNQSAKPIPSLDLSSS